MSMKEVPNTMGPKALSLAAIVTMVAGAAIGTPQAQAQAKDDKDLKGDFNTPLRAQDDDDEEAQEGATGSTHIFMQENGRTYTVEAKNNKLVKVEVDGKKLSKDQYRYDKESGKVEILDPEGNVEKTLSIRIGDGWMQGRGAGGHDFDRAWRDMKVGPMIHLRGEPGAGWNFGGDHPPVMLGITMETDEDTKGVIVGDVYDDLPAAKAGLKAGDVILRIDGVNADKQEAIGKVLRNHKAGDKIDVLVQRDDKERTFTVELQEWDQSRMGGAWAMGWGGPEGFGFDDDAMKDVRANIERELKRMQEQGFENGKEAHKAAQDALRKAMKEIERAQKEGGNVWLRNPGAVMVNPRGRGGPDVFVPQPAPPAPGQADADEVRELRWQLAEQREQIRELKDLLKELKDTLKEKRKAE